RNWIRSKGDGLYSRSPRKLSRLPLRDPGKDVRSARLDIFAICHFRGVFKGRYATRSALNELSHRLSPTGMAGAVPLVRRTGWPSAYFSNSHRLWIDRIRNPASRTPDILRFLRRTTARRLFVDHPSGDQPIADKPYIVRRKLFQLCGTERLGRVRA